MPNDRTIDLSALARGAEALGLESGLHPKSRGEDWTARFRASGKEGKLQADGSGIHWTGPFAASGSKVVLWTADA